MFATPVVYQNVISGMKSYKNLVYFSCGTKVNFLIWSKKEFSSVLAFFFIMLSKILLNQAKC